MAVWSAPAEPALPGLAAFADRLRAAAITLVALPALLVQRAAQSGPAVRLLQAPEVRWVLRARTPVLGLLALAVGAFGQYQSVNLRHPEQATVWFLLAAALGIAAFTGTARAVPFAAPVPVPRPRRLLSLAGIALALILSAALLAVVKADHLSPLIPLLWGAGIIVFLVAVNPVPPVDLRSLPRAVATLRPAMLPTALWQRLRRADPDLAGFALVVIAAAATRLIALDAFPSGMHGDEGEIGWQARKILAGQPVPIFGADGFFGANLIFYGQALFLWLVGDNLIGLRAFAAVGGTLSVVFLWLFARLCFGGRVATIAGLLLAFSPVHVHFSRMALGNALATLAATAGLYLLARGLVRGRSLDFALAGLVIGLGTGFYHGGRVLLIVFAAVLAALAVLHPRRLLLFGRGLALSVVGFWLVLAPYIHPATTPAFLWDRTNYVSAVGQGARDRLFQQHQTRDLGTMLWKQSELVMSAFIWRQDVSTFYPFPGEPILSSAEAVLFVVGLAYLTWSWWSWPFLVTAALFWATFLAGGVLTIDQPSFTRVVGLLPFVYLAVALPIERVLFRVPVGGRVARLALAGAATVLVAVISAAGVEATFVRHAQAYPWAYATTSAQYIAGLGTDVRAYMIGTPIYYFDYATIRFLARGVPGESLHNPQTALPPADEPARASIFLVHPALEQYLPMLRSVFPAGRVEPVRSPKGELILTAVRVSPEQVLEGRGFLAQQMAGGKVGQATIVRPAGTSAERLCAPAPSWPATVRWNALLNVTEPGPYGFRLAGPTARLWLDGVQTAADSAPRELVRGFHRLAVEATMASPEDCPTLRWTHPRHGEQPVPLRSLVAVDAGQGLRARVASQAGRATVERVDRLVGFRDAPAAWGVQGPFTVTWDGAIEVPTAGQYVFEVFSAGDANVEIDGRRVLAHPPRPNASSAQAPVSLTAGRHPFRMTYTWSGRGWDAVELIWTPPGGARHVVPPSAFWGPQS